MKRMIVFSINLVVALAGCEKVQRMIMDGVPSDSDMDNTLTGMQSNPGRLVLFIDYPRTGWHSEIAKCEGDIENV